MSNEIKKDKKKLYTFVDTDFPDGDDLLELNLTIPKKDIPFPVFEFNPRNIYSSISLNPTAYESDVGRAVLYLGTDTSNFQYGHFYTAQKVGNNYEWVDVGIGGGGGGGTQVRYIYAEDGVLTIPAETGWLNIWNVEDGVEVVLATPEEGQTTLVVADFVMGDTAYTFTFNNVTWKSGVPNFPVNEITHLKFEYVDGGWVGYEDPAMSQYMPKSGGTFTGPITLYTGTYGNDPVYYHGRTFISYNGSIYPQSVCVNGGIYSEGAGANYSSIGIGYNIAGGPSNVGQLGVGHYGISITGARFTGAGTSNNDRKNIEELDWEGNLWVSGSMTSSGDSYSTLTATSGVITVPALTGEYYTCTVAQDDTITFATTTASYVTKFSFDITVPETSEGSGTPVSFSFSDIITWEGGSMPTFGVGTHKLKFECVNGAWYGSYRPDMSEYIKFNDSISYSGINWVAGEGYYAGRSLVQLRRYSTQSQYTFVVGNNNSVFAIELYCTQFRLSSYPMVNFHSANTPGGLLYAELNTGNLPAPGAVITKGNYLTALTSSTISSITPVSGSTYTYTLVGDEVITFASPTAGYSPTFEVWLTMPSTAVTFSFGTTIVWSDGNGRFSSYNPAPDFSEGGVVYRLVFQYDGTDWLGNLVSVKEVQ